MAEKNSKKTVSPWHNTLKNLVQGYKKPCWPELPLDWSRTTSFSRRVLTTLQKHVPAGRWTTYKELARLCDSPGAARAVGRTMACNPWPLYIPCHRVLPTTGGIGNFGQGPKLKQTLLLLEGACLPE
jgi:methylated-DNA-[protein]-cysteine S-methyltransferase